MKRENPHIFSQCLCLSSCCYLRILCWPLKSCNLIHICQNIYVVHVWNSLILSFCERGHNKISFTSGFLCSISHHIKILLCFCLCVNRKNYSGPCKCPCFLYITLVIIEYINVYVYVCRSHVIYVLVQIQVLCDRDWKRRSKDWDANRLLPRVIQDTQPGNTTYRKEENCSLKRIRLKPWIEAELWTDIWFWEYRQK